MKNGTSNLSRNLSNAHRATIELWTASTHCRRLKSGYLAEHTVASSNGIDLEIRRWGSAIQDAVAKLCTVVIETCCPVTQLRLSYR